MDSLIRASSCPERFMQEITETSNEERRIQTKESIATSLDEGNY
jgi:hypothetical protein